MGRRRRRTRKRRKYYKVPLLREAVFFAQVAPLRAGAWLARRLPAGLLAWLGRRGGDLARRLDRRHASVARDNLARAFPEWGPEEVERTVRATFRHFGLLLRDLALFERWVTPDNWRDYFEVPEEERIREIYERKRGVVLVTGHLGAWELAGTLIALLGYPITAVAHLDRNPQLRRMMAGARMAAGQRLVFADDDPGRMTEVLRRGEVLALAADRRNRRFDVPVRFFGRLVNAPRGPALVALRTRAPMLTAACFRIGEDFRFRVQLGDVLEPDRSGGLHAALPRLSQAYMSSLEALIRRHPEQWVWFHGRWRDAERLERQARRAP